MNPDAITVVGGMTMELTRKLIDAGAELGTYNRAGTYVFTAQQDFKWLLLDLMQEEGVEVLFHSTMVDAVKDGSAICGVVVENKSGRQVLLGRVVVDASGDGDIAARAGAPYMLGVGPEDYTANLAPKGTLSQMGVMFRMGNVVLDRLFKFFKDNPQHFVVQRIAKMPLDEVMQRFKNRF